MNPELVNVWMMVDPLPFANPVTFPELPLVVQVKVVPATFACMNMLVGDAEQTWEFVTGLVTLGRGLTVTTIFWGIPAGQPNAVGVTW